MKHTKKSRTAHLHVRYTAKIILGQLDEREPSAVYGESENVERIAMLMSIAEMVSQATVQAEFD